MSLGEGAKLTATAGLLSDGTVSSNAGASLSLLSDQPGTMYSAQSWELSGQDTSLNVGAGGIITGDINANDAASISLARLILTNPQITMEISTRRWQV